MTMWELWGLGFQYLGHVISVVLILAILSGKKEARSTFSWLLLVLFLPYVGALAYLVFGRSPVRFPERRHSARADVCPVPPPETPEPVVRTTRLTSRSPSPCRRLELLPGAEEKYRRLEEDIRQARSRVALCYYVFRRRGVGRRLLELLAEKASEGVEVLLLYDGWGAFELNWGGYLRPYLEQGVRARPFHPVADPLQMSRINYRNHRKIAVIDGRVGYTGSINVGDEYLGLHHRFGAWRDIHARLEGEAVRDLEAVLLDDWEISTGERLEACEGGEGGGDTWVHVLPSGPNEGSETVFPLIFAQFAAARDRIDILTPYLVPDNSLVAALRIAAGQGVRVRVLLPGRSNHPMVAAAGRSYYEELLEGGVSIYETRDCMLHAKGILVDDQWALVGSTNLDNRSFRLNFEINLATSDPGFCRSLALLFERWVADAAPVRVDHLAARSLPRRLLEGACRTLSPVL